MRDGGTSRGVPDAVARARAGEPGALEELLERNRARLLERIRLMMGEPARRLAESGDFLQGLYVEVCAGFGRARVANEREFLRWATGIARNNIRDEVRRRRERALESFVQSGVLPGGIAAGASPSADAALGEELERLVEGLEALAPEHREVLELRDFEGLSFRAIGARTGRSENAAQLLHARALLKLGGLLER